MATGKNVAPSPKSIANDEIVEFNFSPRNGQFYQHTENSSYHGSLPAPGGFARLFSGRTTGLSEHDGRGDGARGAIGSDAHALASSTARLKLEYMDGASLSAWPTGPLDDRGSGQLAFCGFEPVRPSRREVHLSAPDNQGTSVPAGGCTLDRRPYRRNRPEKFWRPALWGQSLFLHPN